jgi:HPt (histidine-containing phosphotransfer) domain-containing protein
MSGDTSDEFQNELVDLFVQEAHEWLQNIHVALDEIQQGPPPERHAALINTLTAGVTNLGGSAATINLPNVEQASFAALPFIEAIKDPTKSFSVQDFLSLCKQLGQIHTALTKATGVSFDAEAEGETVEAVPGLSPAEFVETLRKLQSKQETTGPLERNLIKTMIDQMEGQVQAGVQHVGVDVIQGYLDRMSESEEAFVQVVEQQMPTLTAQLSSLADPASMSGDVLEASIREVTQLRAEAQQVSVTPAMTFFSGLHSLLSVLAQHRISLAAARVQAITDRLSVVRKLIYQWVERGRSERAAIGQALPAR